jgi:hypothetical protein
MKFGKITSKNVSHNAIALGGALGGGALSGGLVTLVPQEQKIYARGGITVAGLLGASAIKGTTSVEKVVKFLLLGMSIRQGFDLVKELAEPSIQVDQDSTGGDKFVAGMVGLACPSEEFSALRAAPVINFDQLPAKQEAAQIEESYEQEQEQPVSAFL